MLKNLIPPLIRVQPASTLSLPAPVPWSPRLDTFTDSEIETPAAIIFLLLLEPPLLTLARAEKHVPTNEIASPNAYAEIKSHSEKPNLGFHRYLGLKQVKLTINVRD